MLLRVVDAFSSVLASDRLSLDHDASDAAIVEPVSPSIDACTHWLPKLEIVGCTHDSLPKLEIVGCTHELAVVTLLPVSELAVVVVSVASVVTDSSSLSSLSFWKLFYQ